MQSRGEHKKYVFIQATQIKVTKPIKYKPNSFGQHKNFKQKKQEIYTISRLKNYKQTAEVTQNTKSNNNV